MIDDREIVEENKGRIPGPANLRFTPKSGHR
jgi:hypothetical protein